MIERSSIAGRLLAALIGLAAFTGGLCAALALDVDDGDAATRNYIQVTAREYYYGLSKTRVKPGSTTFELVNYGEDDHDLALRRVGSSSTRKSSVVRPGGRTRLTTKLRNGTYLVWCTVDDHRSRGMSSKIKVRR